MFIFRLYFRNLTINYKNCTENNKHHLSINSILYSGTIMHCDENPLHFDFNTEFVKIRI